MKQNIELKGFLNRKVIEFFGLEKGEVYIGEQNILHMKSDHYSDYDKYFVYISEIISSPDYIGKNPRNDSLELVKEFFCEETKNYVKIAIRISQKGTLFVRTLYTLNSSKFEFQVSKGSYKKVQNL